MAKKKKSIFSIILNLLIIFVFIAILAVGGAIGFVYFKYKVNVFACIDQISQLNREVDVSTLVTNGPTETDYNSVETKIQTAKNGGPITQLSFTDKELCAYLSHNLESISDFNFAGTPVKTKDSKLEILQITLSNIDQNQPSEHFCNLNIVLKLNIAKFKDEKLNRFPMNLFKNLIPNVLYINANCSIDKDNTTYKVTPLGISINNLSIEKTKSFFANINQFTQFVKPEDLNQNISSTLADALIGTNSVYSKLAEHGATGYGWQSENIFNVYFVNLSTTHTITYIDSLGADNNNITSYTIQNNIITLQDLHCNGYDFKGWYLDVNDESTRVTTIDASLLQDYELTCKWSIIYYTITYNLRNGTIPEGTECPTTYTVLDEVQLPSNLIKQISESLTLEFAGWLGDNLTTKTKFVTIPQGSYGNRNYTAYYVGENVTLNMYVDNVAVHTSSVETGTELSLEDLNHLIEDKLSGYTINHWYTNTGRTNEYDYSQIITDTTIYATATYLNNCVYFYPYLTQIENALNHAPYELNITSREMLIGYIDYCVFYDIHSNGDANLTLTYMAGSNSQDIVDEIESAHNELQSRNHYRKNHRISYSYDNNVNNTWYAHYYLTDSDDASIATNHYVDGNVYTQQDCALRKDDWQIRANDFDEFEINNVGKQIQVSTTEQLVWVLENGYRPDCVPSSSAERIYNRAKEILIDICYDEMDDVAKMQAIYKWLALHVNYDQEAYTTYTTLAQVNQTQADETARTYDSWYAEGVFDWGKAVCEGYAKALLIMAKLEGIPAIRVSGNGHMWNRVYINGKWYGIDATHGDMGLNGSLEIFTNSSFLFTDAYKTQKHYTAENYTEFVANDTTFNAYDHIDFTYNGHVYDLFIDNQAELSALLNYVNGYSVDSSCSGCDFYTIEVAVSNANKNNFDDWFDGIPQHYGWSIITFSNPAEWVDSQGNTIIMLQHNK